MKNDKKSSERDIFGKAPKGKGAISNLSYIFIKTFCDDEHLNEMKMRQIVEKLVGGRILCVGASEGGRSCLESH